MLEAIPETTTTGLTAMTTRAHLLSVLGMDESAHAIYASLAQRFPGVPSYLRLLAESEESRGHRERALELRRQLLALRVEDTDSRHALVQSRMTEQT